MSEFKSGFFVGGDACNGRVLVVDDEPDIRKVVKMTLQKAGYDVLEAEIDGTRPLSVTMSEKITALREWARERAVRADD